MYFKFSTTHLMGKMIYYGFYWYKRFKAYNLQVKMKTCNTCYCKPFVLWWQNAFVEFCPICVPVPSLWSTIRSCLIPIRFSNETSVFTTWVAQESHISEHHLSASLVECVTIKKTAPLVSHVIAEKKRKKRQEWHHFRFNQHY